MTKKILSFSLFLGCFLPVLSHAQCGPFMGVGSVQFLDNTAKPLQSGVLYVFQAGTSTQQATFTSSTCNTVNTNPLAFGTGARASIWLNTSLLYKFVLCAQNDGPACNAADILFSVDQVPGGSSGGGGGGGSPFIGVFISGSSNPASAGAARLATGDLLCFRNAVNSGNLCISKDSNDLLTWGGGSLKLPEGNTPTPITGFDIIEADINAHRYEQCSNGAACTQIVNAGVDINTSDQVTQLHFGATAAPLNTTAPVTGQYLKWDGAHISGGAPESIFSWGAATPQSLVACPSSVLNNSCLETIFTQAHTLIRVTYSVDNPGSGCAVALVVGFRDVTSSTNLFTSTVSAGAGTLVDSGALSVAMTAGDTFLLGILTTSSGCGVNPAVHGLTVFYQ